MKLHQDSMKMGDLDYAMYSLIFACRYKIMGGENLSVALKAVEDRILFTVRRFSIIIRIISPCIPHSDSLFMLLFHSGQGLQAEDFHDEALRTIGLLSSNRPDGQVRSQHRMLQYR